MGSGHTDGYYCVLSDCMSMEVTSVLTFVLNVHMFSSTIWRDIKNVKIVRKQNDLHLVQQDKTLVGRPQLHTEFR